MGRLLFTSTFRARSCRQNVLCQGCGAPGGAGAYLLVVLLQAAELLPQRLQLCLQVRPAESELIQDLAQAVNVSLHALAKGQLRLVPESEKGSKTE